MRRPSGKIPEQPLTYLWPKHREIVRRSVLGERPCDIARDLGMTDTRVSIILNSPMTRAFSDSLEDGRNEATMDIKNKLDKLRPLALETLEGVLRDSEEPNKSLRVRVAETILDRTGFHPGKANDGSVTVTLEQYVKETLQRIEG